MKFGISDLTVVPIRKDPSDKSEMVSQLFVMCVHEVFHILDDLSKYEQSQSQMIRLVLFSQNVLKL